MNSIRIDADDDLKQEVVWVTVDDEDQDLYLTEKQAVELRDKLGELDLREKGEEK